MVTAVQGRITNGLVAIKPAPVNTLRPRQNDRHFADDILICIFGNEKFFVLIKISLKFVPKGPVNNIPVLIQRMAWRRLGNKPFSEPMVVSFLCIYIRYTVSMS